VLLVGAATAQAAGAPSLAAAYSSNGVSANIRAVQPAVSGLFQVNAPRAWVDALDESGNPGQNGIPDFLDTWESFRARTSSAILKNGYAFTTVDALRGEILYAGVERASSGGPSSVVLEFNQKTFNVGNDGKTQGERLLGDLRINAEIDAAGNAGTVSFESYAGETKGNAKFLLLAILSGEGCNDAGTACVVANGALLEVGYNSTVLGKPEKGFAGVQIRTADDYAVGALSLLTSTDKCMQTNAGFNLGCTAKDVKVAKLINVTTTNGCDGTPGDTATFSADAQIVLTAQERFDIGVYLGTDGQQALIGSTCQDFILDPTKSAQVDGDACGDINSTVSSASNPLIVVGAVIDFTVKCEDANADGTLDVPSCVSWRQSGKNELCNSIDNAFPGSPSKCECGFTPVQCLCVPQDACHTAACDANFVCQQHLKDLSCTASDQCHTAGTCDPATGTCSNPVATNGSPCTDNNSCTTESCQDGVCTVSGSVTCPAPGQCHVAGTCDPATGTCSNPIADNGSACTDNNLCTTESCQDGTCTVSRSVICPAPDQCHTPGTCNSSTGVCSNPAQQDGTPCNSDNNQCTVDTCQGGTCTVGGCGSIPENAVCTVPNP